ncbi:hypothetical protein SESBI_47432 [Sesbania bispinosa]|nr:hypothetical protein SESBI_47432 [Sesbania bispinosa]
MHVKLHKVPNSWICEECKPRELIEKGKVTHACADREVVNTLSKKGKDFKTSFRNPKTSNSLIQSPLSRESQSKKLGKEKLKVIDNCTSLKQSSYGAKKIGSSYESSNLGSQTEIPHDKCSLLNSSSSKATKLKPEEQLTKVGCLQKHNVERNSASDDDGKEAKDPTMVSKSVPFSFVFPKESNDTCSKALLLDAYDSQNPVLMHLQASDYEVIAEEREKRIISEHLAEVAKSICMHKLCNVPASDERSHLRDLAHVEALTLSQSLIIPMSNYAWQGKFQIHNIEGITNTCDGIQAHLSTHASRKVLEVVDKFPKIIKLDELPRLRIWPSQFMGNQATEENIALYFFAKDADSYGTYYVGLMNYMTKNDFALKGKLDDFELLIFPSNVLPKESQRWNQMLFFWGVFKGRKVINSANTSTSHSFKPENKNTMTKWAFDLNAYPQDEGDEVGDDEIPEFDSTGGTKPSEDITLLVEDNNCSKRGKSKAACVDVDVNISVQTRSAMVEDGFEGTKDNVEEPKTSLPLSPSSTTIHVENLDSLDFQLAETLILLSKDRF